MQELLSAFGIEWQLLLAQGVNFAIVLGALTYFLYKPVLKMLEERQEKIAKGIKDAEEAALSRAEVEGARSGIISKAEKDAEAVMTRAAEEGKRERAEIVKAAQSRAEQTARDAEAQAQELQRRALRDSEKEIAQTAILAAEKILTTK